MSSIRGEDAALPFEVMPSRFCPRKLKKGQIKRYMSVGPLVGYMVACPACGFIEMHMKADAGYVEGDGGTLLHTTKPVKCMLCKRTISIAGGVIAAVSQHAHPA